MPGIHLHVLVAASWRKLVTKVGGPGPETRLATYTESSDSVLMLPKLVAYDSCMAANCFDV